MNRLGKIFSIGTYVASGLMLLAGFARPQTSLGQTTVTWTQTTAGAYSWTDANWDLRVPGTGGNDTDAATFPSTINGQTVTYDAVGPNFYRLNMTAANNATLIVNAPMTNRYGWEHPSTGAHAGRYNHPNSLNP